MKFTLTGDIGFNKEELKIAIANAIFDIVTSGDNRELCEMTLWDVSDHLSGLIADEIIVNMEDIVFVV